jgi:hypothetical protein
MNYLTKFFFIILLFLNSIIFADDNKILFKVNENIFSTIDLKNRIKYLEILNSSEFNSEMKIELMNDFYNTIIFYEYVKNNNFLNNILKKESEIIFEEILLNNNINNYLNPETIKNNIKYDLSRKIMLENILDSYKEYIFSNPNDINFIYNYKIKYITIPTENLISDKEFEKIIDSQNFTQIIEYLEERKFNYHFEETEVKDFNKINERIKNLTNYNTQYLVERNSNFYKIIKVEKKLGINKGVYFRLVNIETDQILKKDHENCNYIKTLDNIKSAKEYDFNKLNNEIKNNLVSINDFVIFKKDNLFNYIFLCEIRVNDEFLKEININKKINIIAKNIELDFVNKYSKLYNTQKYYE